MKLVDAQYLEQYLHEHIPLSQHLGVRVLEAGPNGVRLGAPLGPNLNHWQTAFGGSLAAVAILSAWSCVYLQLHLSRLEGRIIIQSNSMKYLAPAEGDFVAECRVPDPEHWAQFQRTLERRGRARLELAAEVHVGERIVGRFQGRYAVLAPAGVQLV